MGQFGDNFIPVISVEYLVHEMDRPFYWDMTCSCKSDQILFTEVQQFIRDGLLTVDEATLFYCGKTV